MDMSVFRDLCSADGPFASVYFENTHESADAAKEHELRWRNTREKLESHGVDEPTLTAMERVVLDETAPETKSGRALIAAGGDVLLDAELPAPPKETVVRYSRLPHLMPLLEHRRPGVPHVVVVADSTGGEVYGFRADGSTYAEDTVDGEPGPVHKARGVALKHRKAQRRVDNTVAKNVDEVLDHAEKLVSRTGAPLLILAGEIQTRAALRERLSPRSQAIAVETETGGRAEGAGDDALWDAVDALIAQHTQAREADHVERFRAESGRDDGLAVSGMDAVVGALRMANVDALLVADPALGGQRVGVGEDASDVSTGGDLPAGATTEPADAALLAAAALTGATVLVVPEFDVDGNVGAVLRHT